MDKVAQLNAFRTHINRYVQFTDAEWDEFTEYLTFSHLHKKQYFAEDNKVCEHFGYVVAGSVRYFHIKDGEEITSYFSFADDLASSYKSFVQQVPGTYYIQAIEETWLVTLNHINMQRLLDNPRLAYKTERFGRLVAEHYLCCYEDRVQAFITQSPEERYIQLLSEGQEVMQRIPQHYIANYLGITPVSLSRIRKRIFAGAK